MGNYKRDNGGGLNGQRSCAPGQNSRLALCKGGYEKYNIFYGISADSKSGSA